MERLGLALLLIVCAICQGQQIINQDDQCLNAHNLLRSLHQGTGALVWDSTLARESATYAQKLAREGRLHHSRGNYGENLFMKWGGTTSCAYAIKSWYDESKNYNYNGDYQSGTGHFTAMVWTKTTNVGVGIAYQASTRTIAIVARYTPRGNMLRRFTQHVKRLKPGAIVPSLSQLENSGPGTGTGTGGTGTGGVITQAPPSLPPITNGPILTGNNQCLNAHNILRALHQGTNPLQWDAQLASDSTAYAQKLARAGRLTHSRGSYGENLYMAWGGTTSCAKAIKSWYDEESLHNYNSDNFNYNTGHFTQVVWKGSTHVGVGIGTYGNRVAVVARYTPAGNYRGRFTSNVARRKSNARVPTLSELEKSGSGTGTGGVVPTHPPTLPPRPATQPTQPPTTLAPQTQRPSGSNQCLNAHNMLRAIHQGTNPLQWDAQLASDSTAYAQKLARSGRLTHSRGNYGENLYMAWGGTTSCAKAVKSWYDEESKHNYNSNNFNYNTGHFTQVVWKGSTHVGVGIGTYGNRVAVVARYTPAGNYRGRFTSNVARRKSNARVPTLSELENSGTGPGTGTGGVVPTQRPSCKDSSYQCRSFGRYCGRNQWVDRNCKKTCNKC